MSSVPERPSIIGKIEYEPDEQRVVDGLISVLTYRPRQPDDTERELAEHDWSGLDAALVRLLEGVWRRRQQGERAAAETEPAAPTAPKRRKARPKPSRLAKWEASWQAGQSDEAQS